MGDNGAVSGVVGVSERTDAPRRASKSRGPRPAPDAGSNGSSRPPRDVSATNPPVQLTYVPGLDGLRAVSVLAVMLWHFRPDRSLLRGGYLGVEVFFVISGYLITSLLLAERRRRGKIDFGEFWLRRIRRLWPALFLMLIVTGLVIAIFYNEELGRLKGDLLFGFYAENWWGIFHHLPYVQADATTAATLRQPFQHLWSLAVEEQFYLFWPLELALGLFLLGRRRFRAFIAVQAAFGYVLMVTVAARGHDLVVHGTDSQAVAHGLQLLNFAYMSTLTRMSGLLLGCLLAFSWTPYRLRGPAAPNAGRVLDGVAVGAFALLVVLFVQLRDTEIGLYYWGFFLTDIATILLIAAIMHPSSNANRLFGVKPLRAIGVRSYGIYLWGIAIFELTRPGRHKVGGQYVFDWNPSTFWLWTVRLVLVAVVVELSYRYVETPIRRGALGRAWRALRDSHGERRQRLALRWQVGGVVVALAVASLATVAAASTDRTNAQETAGLDEVGGGNCLLHGTCAPPTAPTTSPTVAPGTGDTVPRSTPTTVPKGLHTGGWAVSAVGDSVMLGAQQDLIDTLKGPAGGPVYVNAVKSRQARDCVGILQTLARDGSLAPLVLVHCGTNGTIAPNFVDQVMRIAGPRRKVVFYTLKMPRPWQLPDNALIKAHAHTYRNARVIDWSWFAPRAVGSAAFFYQDQTHLTPPGRAFYAHLTLDLIQNTWHWL